jgi:predicted DNA-binding transcriptional regulator AlpA
MGLIAILHPLLWKYSNDLQGERSVPFWMSLQANIQKGVLFMGKQKPVVLPFKAKKEPYAVSFAEPHNPRRFIRKEEVKHRFGITADSSLYHLISSGDIPRPIHINNGRSAFWLESAVETAFDRILAAGSLEDAK